MTDQTMNWADLEAERAFSPDVVMSWPRAGWCLRCKQPVGAWSIDVTGAKQSYAQNLRDAFARGRAAAIAM